MVIQKNTLIEIIEGNSSKLFCPELNISSIFFSNDARDVSKITEDVVDTGERYLFLDRKGEDRAM